MATVQQPKRDWTAGIFGCCADIPTCLCAYCCPCWQFGSNANRLGSYCCCLVWFVPCLNWFCATRLRGKLREQRNISGSVCGDCCTHAVCHCCALVQESRELDMLEAELVMMRNIQQSGNTIIVSSQGVVITQP